MLRSVVPKDPSLRRRGTAPGGATAPLDRRGLDLLGQATRAHRPWGPVSHFVPAIMSKA